MRSIAAISAAVIVLMLLLAGATAVADAAPDYAREQRIAEQVVPQIFDGEAVWLNDGERDFFAIHTEADNPMGSVIVMHGRDVNPEDINVAGPVRVGLAENGWSTLAIQLPTLGKGRKYYDYLPVLPFAHGRIEAAINFVRAGSRLPVVIAAHSCGAHMANSWLNENGAERIDGYIAIGLGATDAGQPLKTPIPIGNIRIPVLDIYGSEEFAAPLSMVEMRRTMIKQNGNPSSAQIKIEGANHYFKDRGDDLAEQILEWLNAANFINE